MTHTKSYAKLIDTVRESGGDVETMTAFAECMITAYKAALAQPAQQEPVAVVETLGGYPDESRHEAKWLVPYRALKDGDNLYTTPQPAQEPEIYSRWQETIAGIPVIFESEADANRFMEYHFANAGKPIEQPAPVPVVRERPSFAEWTSDHVRDSLHKLKPAQQEPTGMLHIDRLEKWLDASLKERKSQRPWVGLTDEDKETLMLKHAPPIHPDHQDDSMGELIEAVGNLLKDKNA